MDRLTGIFSKFVLWVAIVFLLLPAVLIVIVSFSADRFVRFPPDSYGLDRFAALFASDVWLASFRLSLVVGLGVGILSVILGVTAVLATQRTRLGYSESLQTFSIATLILPVTAFSVAMYGTLAQFRMLGTLQGLILATTALAVPFVLITVDMALRRAPMELEFAAMSLGSNRPRAWFDVILRLLVPGVLAGFVLGFQTGFEEAVFVNFVGGPNLITLPKRILDSVQFENDPVIPAIASTLTLITFAIAVAVGIGRSRIRNKRGNVAS